MPEPALRNGSPVTVGGARRPALNAGSPDLDSLYQPEEVARLVASALGELEHGDSHVLDRLVRPGDQVVLKPNLLRHDACHSPEWRHVITHPSLIQAVINLVAPRLGAHGRIVVTDGPQTDSSFEKICRQTGLREMVQKAQAVHGIPVTLLDLRQEEWTTQDGVITSRRSLPGDPLGYCDIDLGSTSAFAHCAGEGHYYGASFDTDETNREHRNQRHRYRLSRTIMDADLIINMPKLKTHKKAGITASLKNLVGANGNKNWLPHYTVRHSGASGDQYPPESSRSMEAALIRHGKRLLHKFPRLAAPLLPLKSAGRMMFGATSSVIRSGNWSGNDTLWRMVLDLNRAVLWHDATGDRRRTPRRYLTVVDAILAGDGAGPEAPQPRTLGWVLAGTDPVAVDTLAARLMGFPWQAIPTIARAYEEHGNPLTLASPDDVFFAHEAGRFLIQDIPSTDTTPCRPHFGWQRELAPSVESASHLSAGPAHAS